MKKPVLLMIAEETPETLAKAITSARSLVSGVCVVVSPGSAIERFPEEHSEILEGLEVRWLVRPWQGFRDTTNLGMEVAETMAPWVLQMDADDVFEAEGSLPDLENAVTDVFEITIVSPDGTRYPRSHLFRSSCRWRWRYVIHCVAEATAGPARGPMFWPGLVYLWSGGHGDYAEQAKLLQEEHDKDPTCTRTCFYLAQSYRDAGDDGRALRYYVKRGNMTGGFAEENFESWLQAGHAAWRMGLPWESVEHLFRYAMTWGTNRAEPLRALANLLRAKGDRTEADRLDARADAMAWPTSARLFVDANAYHPSVRPLAALTHA